MNIALAFVLLALLTVFINSVLSYYLSQDAVQENAQDYTTELIGQVNSNIRSYVSGMEYMAELVAGNRDVQEYLSEEPSRSAEEARLTEESASAFLQSLLVTRTDIASVSIFGENGTFVSGQPELQLNPHADFRSMSWYRQAQEAGGRSVLSSSHVQPVFKNRYPWVVSLSRELYSRDGQRRLGVFLVDLNFSVMNNMLQGIRLGQRGYLFIVDSSGKLVYHPQQQLVYSRLKSEQIDSILGIGSGSFVSREGGDSRMYTVQDSGFGWKIVGVSYVGELVGNKAEVRLSFLLLAAGCVALAILLSIGLSSRLTRPLQQLQGYMKEVERGSFDIQVPVPDSSELGRLARAFNLMVGRIRELMEQTRQDQELKRRSELSALQAQIHPHFLYNTLDSIVWMAESGKSREVVTMTSSLARLLRASIGRGEAFVSIRTELEHISAYLTIQKMRYRDKFDYSIDIDPGLHDYQTVKTILQPVVENALYHGVKKKRGPGRIRISSEETPHEIRLIVSDDGAGMGAEQLRTLLHPGQRLPGQGTGVGVRNVHDRLQLNFGAAYGLSYSSEPGLGTTATLTFPKLPQRRLPDAEQV